MADLQIVPAYKNVEAQYVEMMVPLYSYGCEKKIKKALSNLRGIYSVSVDFKLQKVTVWGICNKYDVLATIRSKRKEARFWDADETDYYPNEQQQQSINEPHQQVVVISTKPFISRLGRSLSWKALKKVIIKSY
ncbi:Heavy metal-associated domain [Macleaya cordata]|uniref:Heavy metal-associated domain n=1 Tax=Macleaya cordata TaxID=56857 RepID=A0A200RB41_MACCD|nr:Heavy metal-associated domain [Macleaya cordata]